MNALPFEYRALDQSGRATRGTLSATSKDAAYRRLVSMGLTPVRISETRGGVSGVRKRRSGRVRAADVSHFTHQLSVLLEARIPVVDCFKSIAEQGSHPGIARICNDIASRVQSGTSITEAMETHSKVFGTVYVETLRAAERSGNMIKVLGMLAEMVEEQHEMRRQLKGAMMYPITVVVALTVASAFLITFVVPKFAHLFESRGVKLPFLTQMLMSVGDSVKGYWFAYLLVIGLLFLVARSLCSTPRGRLVLDRLLHRIPFVKEFLVGLASGRFASVLGLGLSSGLGLIECLEMSGRSAGRPMLLEDARSLVKGVTQGRRMADMLPSCAYLPGFVTQLLRAGEEAGELPRMCGIIARHYTRESRHMAKNASTIVEPVLIAGLTGVVLVIALAVFLPMWDMVSLIG